MDYFCCGPTKSKRVKYCNEASSGVEARALHDYNVNQEDPNHCSFREGNIITVVERGTSSGLWRGYRCTADGYVTRPGYFPATAVILLEQDGFRRSPKNRKSNSHSPKSPSSSRKNQIRQDATTDFPLDYSKNNQQRSGHNTPAVLSDRHHHKHGTPVRPSSGGNEQSRSGGSGEGESSSSSNRSSTASSTDYSYHQFDGKNRLSVQSCESGVSAADIPVSSSVSSSSQGSFNDLEESGYSSSVNVHDLLEQGLSDSEILLQWLSDLHLEDVGPLFLQAGYDMPTISRMTPEDLVAIGITKPSLRKKLKSEIGKLCLKDGIPDFKPKSMGEWLRLLHLEQYHQTLLRQGYSDMDNITCITWEDLEEIGIQLLGHQKKIMLGVEKIKKINSNLRQIAAGEYNASIELLPLSSAVLQSQTSASALLNLSNKNHVRVASRQPLPTLEHFNLSYDQLALNRIRNERRAILNADRSSVPMTSNSSGIYDNFSCRNSGSPSIQVCTKMRQSSSFVSDVGQSSPNGLPRLPSSPYSSPISSPVFYPVNQNEELDSDLTPTNRRKTLVSPVTSEGNYITRSPNGLTRQFTANNSPQHRPSAPPLFTKIVKASPTRNYDNVFSLDISNHNAGGFECNEQQDAFNERLGRRSPVKRRLENTQFVAGSTQPNSCLNRYPIKNSDIFVMPVTHDSTRMSSPSHQPEPMESISPKPWQLEKKPPPTPPKRTHLSKLLSHTGTAIVGNKFQPTQNNRSNIIISNGRKMNEIQCFEESTVGEDNSVIMRSQSDCLPPKSPSHCTPNRFPTQKPVINYGDLVNAESLLGDAIKYLELTSSEQNRDSGINYGSCNIPVEAFIHPHTKMFGTEIRPGGAEARLAGLGAAVQRSPRHGNFDSGCGREQNMNSSNVSLESVGSGGTTVDSNTLPFANENVGTIKQRIALNRPSVITSSGSEANSNMFSDSTDAVNCNHQNTVMTPSQQECSSGHLVHENNGNFSGPGQNGYRSGVNSVKAFNDIDGILLGLTKELDAMWI